MVRKKLSKEEIEAFRARGIAAAEALFNDGGIQTVTMRNLAKKLGCSATAPYRYFENHEALVAALRASAFSRFADRQQEEVRGIDGPRTRLERIARVYVAYAVENPNAYQLMFSIEPPGGRDLELEAQSRRSFTPLLNAAHDAVEAGDVQGPADIYAHLFWAHLHGLVSLQFSNKLNFGTSLDVLVDAFLERLFER